MQAVPTGHENITNIVSVSPPHQNVQQEFQYPPQAQMQGQMPQQVLRVGNYLCLIITYSILPQEIDSHIFMILIAYII